MLHREVTVHRVAELVGQGRDVVVLILEIHHDERVDAVGRGREGAALLVLRRVDVDPAGSRVEPLGDPVDVIRSQRREGLEDVPHRIPVGHLARGALGQRDVQIVEMHLVDAHDLLSQGYVAMKQGREPPHGLDQIPVDRRIDVVLVEVGLEGGVVAPRPGEEDVEGRLASEGRGEGVFVSLEGFEHRLDGPPANLPVLRTPQAPVVGKGQLNGVAALVDDLGKVHLGDQCGEGVFRRRGQFVEIDLRPEVIPRQRQDLLGLGS